MSPNARRRLFRAAFATSVALNLLVAAHYLQWASRKGGIRFLLERLDLKDAHAPMLPFHPALRERYDRLPNTPGEIDFVGDSLIGDGPWAEVFSPIKNRGIGGETPERLLERLGEVTAGRPRKLFLLTGANSLANEVPVAQLVRNYRKILDRVRAESPATSVFVISVLPVNQALPGGPVYDNATVRETNRRLEELVREYTEVKFVDVFGDMADAAGDLRADWTTDGLHLNLDGYLALCERLRPYVEGPAAANPAVTRSERKGGHQ